MITISAKSPNLQFAFEGEERINLVFARLKAANTIVKITVATMEVENKDKVAPLENYHLITFIFSRDILVRRCHELHILYTINKALFKIKVQNPSKER
jgi:hypothetical protein